MVADNTKVIRPEQKVAEISLFCNVFTNVSSQKHKIIEENIPFGSNCPKQDQEAAKFDHISSTNVRTQTCLFQRATKSSRQAPLQFRAQVTRATEEIWRKYLRSSEGAIHYDKDGKHPPKTVSTVAKQLFTCSGTFFLRYEIHSLRTRSLLFVLSRVSTHATRDQWC